MHLDGEIWAGRGQWDATVAAVVRNQWQPSVCFMVLDASEIEGDWPQRLATAVKRLRCTFATTVPCRVVADLTDAAALFRDIRLGGGEGVVLRRPGIGYVAGRSCNHVLKLKRCPLTGELAWPERMRMRGKRTGVERASRTPAFR